MTAPTKDDICDQFEQLLWFHFSDDPQHTQNPWWGQAGYKERFFALARKSVGIVHRDTLAAFVKTHWLNRRQTPLAKDDERRLEELLDAWSEWQWVLRKLSEE